MFNKNYNIIAPLDDSAEDLTRTIQYKIAIPNDPKTPITLGRKIKKMSSPRAQSIQRLDAKNPATTN